MQAIWRRLLTNQRSSRQAESPQGQHYEAFPQNGNDLTPDEQTGRSEGGNLTRDSSSHKFWVPLVLRRSVMLVFVSVFVALLLVLIALFVDSDAEHGIDTAEDKNYYLWTYAPTAGKRLINLTAKNVHSFN